MRFAFYFLCFLFFLPGCSQELPPLINFDSNEYDAGNQNWMITQATNKYIYIANGSGLLEYTGEEWNLFSMPNKTAVRSVLAVDDLIFTGAYMHFGYWKQTDFGRLEYVDLRKQLKEPLVDGEQFWHIQKSNNTVIFQSFHSLYFFDLPTSKISKWEGPEESITNLFEVEGAIYFQVAGKGLFTFENAEIKLLIGAEELEGKEIIHAFSKNGSLRLVCKSGGIYSWNGMKLSKVPTEIDTKDISIFSAANYYDGSLLLGTVEDGIFQISEDGKIRFHFNQKNGLLNNTVLSLFVDEDKNIWAGLDNGISVINLDSPFKVFQDQGGNIGAVYASYQNEDYLYLGTNQGLYYRNRHEPNDFKLVPGTNGQVWSFKNIDSTLFLGHNRGTFIVEGTVARQIADRSGTWTIEKLKGRNGVYVQGHYNGISMLRRKNNDFSVDPLLQDFPHSSKSIVSTEDGYIWIGNEHKGVFRINLNPDATGIREIKNYKFENESGITSSIFEFNDTLYYSNKKSIFQYKPALDSFVKANTLNRIIEDIPRNSGKIISEAEEIWGFSKNRIFYVSKENFGDGYRLESIFLPKDFSNVTRGYENIYALDEDSYLLGAANGFLTFEELLQVAQQYDLHINQIEKASLAGNTELLKIGKEAYLKPNENYVRFEYSIPEFKKFLSPQYSYRLLGLNSEWSQWSDQSSANFGNLSFGEYEFQVRGRLGNNVTEPVSFIFEVGKPWFISKIAIILYLLLFFLFLFLLHQFYKKRHQKEIRENEKILRMKNLEAEQKITLLQKEQLENEMTGKNKELAVATMSLIKKNEFLSDIKRKLSDSKGSHEVDSVIRKIDKDINEEDNWKFFQKAFNNADKDFLKKIKTKHPELTANDLKLCAYLRLNLSSKEIAPLLNISPKSVEIKRYRLRKKMNLDKNQHLTDYILEI